MHTFLTPEPITIEIRNASGEIRVDLADVTTTTVDVVAATAHPLGFLDDVIRAAKAQFVGDRQSFRGRPLPLRLRPGRLRQRAAADDPTERVRVEHRPPQTTPTPTARPSPARAP